MFETIKILDKSEKVQFFFLAFLVFLSVLVELLSLGLILPVTSYIFSENSEVNNYIRSFTQFDHFIIVCPVCKNFCIFKDIYFHIIFPITFIIFEILLNL